MIERCFTTFDISDKPRLICSVKFQALKMCNARRLLGCLVIVRFQGASVPEFKILANIIDFMEVNGATAKVVTFEVDQKLADEINLKHGTNYSIADLEKAVDKCVANEWVAHRGLGEKYKYLGITTKGVGAARSRARAEEIKASRTWLKKVSDYIEDHKGLFIFFGFLVALATFASKFLGVK